MSYDFYLFEPDRDAHGNIRRYSRFLSENPDLLTRFQVESGSATPKLEQLAAKINAKIEEKEKFGIYYEKADTSLDRAMVVPVRHGSQDKMLYLLFDAATRSNLGLATDDFLWCYGDEDGNYLVEARSWKSHGSWTKFRVATNSRNTWQVYDYQLKAGWTTLPSVYGCWPIHKE